MKERHIRTGVAFLLLFLIPRESDWWKQRLSNRASRLPVCKQHIKAQFFSCASSPPNICPSSLPVSLSAQSWLSHTFSSSVTLSPPWLSQAFGSYLSSVCSSLVAVNSVTAGKHQAACELLILFTFTILLWLSTKPITPNLPATIHCVFAVSPPQPLTCLVWRDEKEWSRGGDHGLPVLSKTNRLTDGQSQRRTAEIRGLGPLVIVGLATTLNAVSSLWAPHNGVDEGLMVVEKCEQCGKQKQLQNGNKEKSGWRRNPAGFLTLCNSTFTWSLIERQSRKLPSSPHQAAVSRYLCSAFFCSSSVNTGTFSWREGTLQALQRMTKRMRMRTPTTELQTMATMAHTDRPILSSCSMVRLYSRLHTHYGHIRQVGLRSAAGATLVILTPQILTEKKENGSHDFICPGDTHTFLTCAHTLGHS